MVMTAYGLDSSVRICLANVFVCFNRIVFQGGEELMVPKKHQNTVLGACLEEVHQPSKRSISRRKFVQTSAGVVATGALLGKRAFAAHGPLKIGYVSPETGALAPFGESDAFVIDAIRKKFQGGIMAGGATRPVEILVRDSQSNSNRCSEVAASLIKTDKIDLMVVAGTPDTVNPVSDQCEVNQVPCVSTDAPWQPYFFGRGGNPAKGFDWTYHFFWGAELVSQVTCDMFDQVPTNKVVGCLWANDVEGNTFSDPVHGFPPVFESRGYKVIDPGRFSNDINDFSAQIAIFKKANAEIVQGVLPVPTFSNFWTEAAQQGFRPKICVMGKALLFPAGAEALGPRGKNLTCEVWWSPAYPFKSSLTGQSARQLCDAFETYAHKEWTQALGFRYALFEIAADVFKRAQNPDSAASVIEAVRAARIDTIVGPIAWQGPPPNQWTQIPVKNVCTTPMVAGQWVPGKKWMYEIVVTDNRRYPMIPVQRKMVPLPE
jgi:branched-chain amino acid transport system substrate-binding protein